MSQGILEYIYINNCSIDDEQIGIFFKDLMFQNLIQLNIGVNLNLNSKKVEFIKKKQLNKFCVIKD